MNEPEYLEKSDGECNIIRVPNPDYRPRNRNTVINTDVKINRNDPCKCGSGKKYKKCCKN